MSVVMTDGEIEFLDNNVALPAADEDVAVSEVAVASSVTPLRWLALVALLVGGVWFITSTGPDSVDDDRAAADPPAGEPLIEDESDPPVGGPPIVAPVFDTWPNPPRVREPNVVRAAGPAELPEEFGTYALSSTTLVYVNTAGRPTVVSFDTGEVSEVEVAATRIHETFAVQAGRVVPVGPEAREAIIFHTYRDVDRPGIGTMSDRRGVGSGPELCLSGESCDRPGLGLERVRGGDVVAERFDPVEHRLVNDLLSGWSLVDASLVGPDGYRIPEPVGLIWVIAPSTGGSVSSSGLL